MHGSSVTFIGLPLGLVYSIYASRRTRDLGFALTALGILILEWVGLALHILVNVFSH